MEQTTAAPSLKDPAFRAAELDALASIIEEGDGAPAEPETSAKEPTEPSPSGEAAEPEGEPSKPDDKWKEKTEGKSWQKIRKVRQALDDREAALNQRETLIKANETALGEKAKRAEQHEQEIGRLRGFIERLRDGDPEALAALDIDLEKVNGSFLKHQSGEARVDRLEREARERKEADAKRERERTETDEAERIRRTNEASEAELLQEVAKSGKLLAKKSRTQVVGLCNQVAEEWVAEKRSFTFGQLVVETEKRLREFIEADVEALGYTKPAPVKPPTQPLSRRETSERGGPPRKGPVSKDEELQDIAGLDWG